MKISEYLKRTKTEAELQALADALGFLKRRKEDFTDYLQEKLDVGPWPPVSEPFSSSARWNDVKYVWAPDKYCKNGTKLISVALKVICPKGKYHALSELHRSPLGLVKQDHVDNLGLEDLVPNKVFSPTLLGCITNTLKNVKE